MTTTYEGVVTENQSRTVTLSPGETADVDATCDPPNGGTGTVEVVVTVTEADSGSAAIRDAELRAAFDYDCPGREGGGNGNNGNGGGNNGRGNGN